MQIFAYIESIFDYIVRAAILLFEAIGVVVLLITAVKSVIEYFKRSPHLRVNLAEGIALALSFKLGGEVLRTVIVREWGELAILGAIIVLRAAMAFLLAWEIKNEKQNLANPDELVLPASSDAA